MAYYFKMQLTDKDGTATGTVKDLETDFSGLIYVSCSGLETVGKAKNIYTEDYAEESGLRVYHPADSDLSVAYEATDIELDLLFVKSTYRDTYNSFCSFIESGRLFFWDTARHKKVWLVFAEAAEPEEDNIKGDTYIRVTFKFKNIWGIGKKCNDSGTLL